MKKLLVLAVAAVLTASSTGCWHWFNRGAQCGAPAPCGPAPCGQQATYGGAYAAPAGPEYVPGPG